EGSRAPEAPPAAPPPPPAEGEEPPTAPPAPGPGGQRPRVESGGHRVGGGVDDPGALPGTIELDPVGQPGGDRGGGADGAQQVHEVGGGTEALAGDEVEDEAAGPEPDGEVGEQRVEG